MSKFSPAMVIVPNMFASTQKNDGNNCVIVSVDGAD